jgi:hypothetical protein
MKALLFSAFSAFFPFLLCTLPFFPVFLTIRLFGYGCGHERATGLPTAPPRIGPSNIRMHFFFEKDTRFPEKIKEYL